MPKANHPLAALLLSLAMLVGASACTEEPAGTTTGAATDSAVANVPADQPHIDERPTIIDVRTSAEFHEGHLEGAVNIDISAPDFTRRLSALDSRGSYVVYCHSGSRSAQAAAVMGTLGFAEVTDAGGLDSAAATTGLAVIR